MNPDGIAVIVEETLFDGQTTNRYLFREVINFFENIDYPFFSFPVWGGSKQSVQTRLFHHIPTNHLERVEFLSAHGNPSDAAKYARRVLVIDPSVAELEALLKLAISDLTPDQVLTFLRYGKAIIPPFPAWHCCYQNFMEVHWSEHDLQSEYALLEIMPQQI